MGYLRSAISGRGPRAATAASPDVRTGSPLAEVDQRLHLEGFAARLGSTEAPEAAEAEGFGLEVDDHAPPSPRARSSRRSAAPVTPPAEASSPVERASTASSPTPRVEARPPVISSPFAPAEVPTPAPRRAPPPERPNPAVAAPEAPPDSAPRAEAPTLRGPQVDLRSTPDAPPRAASRDEDPPAPRPTPAPPSPRAPERDPAAALMRQLEQVASWLDGAGPPRAEASARSEDRPEVAPAPAPALQIDAIEVEVITPQPVRPAPAPATPAPRRGFGWRQR